MKHFWTWHYPMKSSKNVTFSSQGAIVTKAFTYSIHTYLILDSEVDKMLPRMTDLLVYLENRWESKTVTEQWLNWCRVTDEDHLTWLGVARILPRGEDTWAGLEDMKECLEWQERIENISVHRDSEVQE